MFLCLLMIKSFFHFVLSCFHFFNVITQKRNHWNVLPAHSYCSHVWKLDWFDSNNQICKACDRLSIFIQISSIKRHLCLLNCFYSRSLLDSILLVFLSLLLQCIISDTLCCMNGTCKNNQHHFALPPCGANYIRVKTLVQRMEQVVLLQIMVKVIKSAARKAFDDWMHIPLSDTLICTQTLQRALSTRPWDKHYERHCSTTRASQLILIH